MSNLLLGSVYLSLLSSSNLFISHKSLQFFFHPNVVQVLMGCSVLDMLFQLDLSLLEVLFVYTVKMSQKERFSLCAHIPSIIKREPLIQNMGVLFSAT